jgi:hypothetical protein
MVPGVSNLVLIAFNSFNNVVFSLVALSLASFKLVCVNTNSPANLSASFLCACFLNVLPANLVLNVPISVLRSSSNFSLSAAVAFKVSVVLFKVSFNISSSLFIISQLVIFLWSPYYFSKKKTP